MRRCVLAGLIVVAMARAAHAQGGNIQSGGSLSDHGELVVGGSVTSAGSSSAKASAPLLSYITYRVYGDGPATTGSLAGLCFVTPTIPGFQYRIVGTRPDGSIASDYTVCSPFDATGAAAPPPLPQPPTYAEAWRAAQLPSATIMTDPATRGITGVDTRIWATGPHSKSIDAVVRGYRIVGTATLDHYTIGVDGGATQDAGSGHYIFETKGNHTIVIGAVWHGSATLTGPDLAPVLLPDIGTATLTSTRAYPVNEVRAVLKP